MRGRIATRRLVVGLTVFILPASCAGGATNAPSSTTRAPASAASVATAAPSPPASPTPATSPTVTLVTGTVTCPSPDLGSATRDAVGVTHYRGGTFRCNLTTTDPRVSGTETASWNMDLWGTVENGALVQWGTSRLENAGGAWVGKGSGVYSSDRGDSVVSWFKGTGGYAGLGYFELRTGKNPETIQGEVFPGDPPDLTGLPPVTGAVPSPNVEATPSPIPGPTLRAIAYGPVTVTQGFGGYTVVDIGDMTFAGIDMVNDPRVSGTFLTPSWNTNLGATGDSETGTEWGASRLENAGGAWHGVGSGIYLNGGDLIAIWYKGSGSYAGLAYFELIGRPDLFGGPMVGAYGLFGQVFPGDPPTP